MGFKFQNQSDNHLKILFYAQSINKKDPVIADTFNRVEHLKSHNSVSCVDVVSLRGVSLGKYHYVLGSETQSKVMSLFRFYKVVVPLLKKKKYDIVYVYMCPTHLILFWFLKPFFRFSLVAWFAHTVYKPFTKFSLERFPKLWLSVNKAQAPFNFSHIRYIGQGVELSEFSYEKRDKKYDLVTTGRITPLKKIDLMVEALAMLRDQQGLKYTLAVCGEAYIDSDQAYKKTLLKLVEKHHLQDQVYFLGSVNRDDLKGILNQSRAFIFTIPGGIGKATLEAISCGLPLILSEPKARDFLGDELADVFLCERNVDEIAKTIKVVLELEPHKREALLSHMRERLVREWSMEAFTNRVVHELCKL